MKRRKREMALLLAMGMVICTLLTGYPQTAAATQTETTEDGLEYVVKEDGTVEITEYIGSAAELIIPEEIDGAVVTSIGDEAFSTWQFGLTSVEIPSGVASIGDRAFLSSLTMIKVAADNQSYTSVDGVLLNKEKTKLIRYPEGNVGEYRIPDSVTSIGNAAFYGCGGLTSIEIPSGVTSIGDDAFYGCSKLTSIDLPSGLASIGEQAFDFCRGLTSIEIPSGVASIGDFAFSYCDGLTSVEIPSGVTSIGNGVFGDCSGLTMIEVAVDNQIYTSVDGVLLNKDKTELVCYPNGKTGEYRIPDSVTSIRGYAFRDCSRVTSIEIPSGVTNIGDGAFFGCSGLTSIELPLGLTDVGNAAFSGCSGLTSIKIPSGMTRIGDRVFAHCRRLTSIEIPSGVTSIGDGAFSYCDGLTSIEIPSGVTSIGDDVFEYSSGLTMIEVAADNQNYTSVEGVLLNKDKTELVFCPNGKTGEYQIPDGVTGIRGDAFRDCSKLTSIEIPSGVTSIGDDAFSFCRELTSIKLPDSVTNIGNNAFYECTRLTSIELPSGLTSIGDEVFEGSGLTSIELPDSVTSIGDNAFSSCGRLTSITLPSGLTSIEDGAFFECSSLTSIGIPSGVTNIGDSAFQSCSGLTSIEIPSGVTNIGDSAFVDCSGLTMIEVAADNQSYISLDGVLLNKDKTELICYPSSKTGEYRIPDSVTSIRNSAFNGCSGLTSIEIPSSVTDIRGAAFEYCSGLTSIEIPNSVSSIGGYAFRGCSGLTSIEIPYSVTSIGYGAFHSCDDLVIKCYLDSFAQQYAMKNEIPYELLDRPAEPSETPITSPAPANDFDVVQNDTGVSIEKYTGSADKVGIPAEIDGKPVTKIGAEAFANAAITEVVVPENVTTIGAGAFKDCDKLQKITIPAGVTEIADDAFTGCVDLVICCYRNSQAMLYAQKHGINYEMIDETPVLYYYGDVDKNGEITASDALNILKHVVRLTALTDETALKLADVNHDGDVTAADALGVLKVVVQLEEKESCTEI